MAAPCVFSSLLILTLAQLLTFNFVTSPTSHEFIHAQDVTKYVADESRDGRQLLFGRTRGRGLQLQTQENGGRFLLSCGDICPHPGPGTVKTPINENRDSLTATGSSQRRRKNPCVSCGLGVTKCSKAVTCDMCKKWTHVRCTRTISMREYDQLVLSGENFNYVCDSCSFSGLPFPFSDEGEDCNF
jgi:hypothetical protein